MYDLLVYIGRFQPFHAGHYHVVEEAAKISKNVLILMGSYGSRPNFNNPFSDIERAQMIHEATREITSNIKIIGINDYIYRDTLWVAHVQKVIKEHTLLLLNKGGFHTHGTEDAKVGIIGFNKDHTSYYLKMFPHLTVVELEVPYSVNNVPLSASSIREFYYKHSNLGPYKNHVRNSIIISKVLDAYSADYWYAKQYKKDWGPGPFITADSLVEVGGHILVIERKNGSLALPGGFINTDETLIEASIRELREETRIKVPEKVIRGSLINKQIFDAPNRDLRARIVTQCFHYSLKTELSLPEVRGSDDAQNAFWLGMSDLENHRMDFYADHFHIIRAMLE